MLFLPGLHKKTLLFGLFGEHSFNFETVFLYYFNRHHRALIASRILIFPHQDMTAD